MIDYKAIQSSPALIQLIKEKKVLVVFVHGYGGNLLTWENFTNLIRASSDLQGLFDFEVYEYPTKMWKAPWILFPSLEILAEGLNTRLNITWRNYETIIFVCHSMGGLVCRKFIVDFVRNNISKVLKVKLNFFYATPHKGSKLAVIGAFLCPGYRQVMQLLTSSKTIKRLNNDWVDFGISERVKSVYVVGGRDWVVSQNSAKHFRGNRFIHQIPECGHFDIHKPLNENELSFELFKVEMLTLFNEFISDSSIEADEESLFNFDEDHE